MSIFVFPQIWDLADPEGKGFLDKQVYIHVYTHTHRASGGTWARAPQAGSPLHFLPCYHHGEVLLGMSAAIRL